MKQYFSFSNFVQPHCFYRCNFRKSRDIAVSQFYLEIDLAVNILIQTGFPPSSEELGGLVYVCVGGGGRY